jgi:hypothetical protein
MFIDAIEDSDLLLIDHASHQRMVDAIPAIAAAYRTGLQRLAAARDKRIISSLTASAREPLPGLRGALSDPGAPRALADVGLVSRHDAGDAQPRPQAALDSTPGRHFLI